MTERPEEYDPLVDEAEEAAAEEAAEIGGPDPEPRVDPAERAVIEGGGWAEGFEGSEEQLERNASHEDRGADPMRDAGEDEEDAGSTYGEADHAGAQGDDS